MGRSEIYTINLTSVASFPGFGIITASASATFQNDGT